MCHFIDTQRTNLFVDLFFSCYFSFILFFLLFIYFVLFKNNLSKTYLLFYIRVCVGECATAHVWRPEDSFVESVPPSSLGSRDLTQVPRLAQLTTEPAPWPLFWPLTVLGSVIDLIITLFQYKNL